MIKKLNKSTYLNFKERGTKRRPLVDNFEEFNFSIFYNLL